MKKAQQENKQMFEAGIFSQWSPVEGKFILGLALNHHQHEDGNMDNL